MTTQRAGELPAAIPVTIQVDASRVVGELHPIWRFFGCDEPNYATLPNGRKLLHELGSLGPVYFRTHNLLNSGDGTPALKWGSTNAYTETAAGEPVYDWTILDSIFDSYHETGVRPYVQIGFMPEALSVHPEPYRHHWRPGAKYDEIYTGWAYPPRDYARWGELVQRWAEHCVGRFGAAEVQHWYWEVWNEPNIGYWRGTPQEFHRLHDTAIDAVRRVLPAARVGGPDVAGSGGEFMRKFLDHCLHEVNYSTGKVGTPLDFVSFHAKGAPTFVEEHVRMGIREELRTINQGFALIASYPELRQKPIVIGECDPDGCAACQGPQLGYRNGTMYASYTAASFARIHDLAEQHGVNLEGALTWAFEFENQPCFAGFRALASCGLPLAVLNVFRMFARMGTERLAVNSSGAVALDQILEHGVREAPDIAALASRQADRVAVLLWHYHDDDVPGPEARVRLTVEGLPASWQAARLKHYRIDETHSNAFGTWQQLGLPEAPTKEQTARLEHSSRLSLLRNPFRSSVEDGKMQLEFALPRKAVSLLEIEAA